MPNPFMTSSVVSNEDTAAFSDELTQDAQKKEEHYLKGYSSDDPTIVETNKLQDNASEVVEQTLNNVAEVLDGEVATESKVDENPFIPKASPTEDTPVTVADEPNTNPFEGVVQDAETTATTETEEGSELNPFFNTVAGEAPQEVDVDGDSKPDLVQGIDSLESIREDLEEVMGENKLNSRNTEFLVDVRLEDSGKALLDQDLDAVIATAPEVFESLESIKLCDERSVPQILNILRDKLAEVKSL